MILFLKEFFEEATGKSSMTRLAMLILVVCAGIVALSWCYVTIFLPERLSTQVTIGYASVLAALVANGAVAFYNKSKGDSPILGG